MTKLKICGLTCEEDIAAVNEVKPDFAGFIIEVPSSRRNLSAEQVKVLVKGLDKEILPVGVFVDARPELPISLLRDGSLWAAQLHGNEDEEYIEKIQNMTGKPVIKAFSIKTPEDVQRLLEALLITSFWIRGQGEPENPLTGALFLRCVAHFPGWRNRFRKSPRGNFHPAPMGRRSQQQPGDQREKRPCQNPPDSHDTKTNKYFRSV